MNLKSFLALTLTVALCFTLSLPVAAQDDPSLNISYCEAVRAAVVTLYGEQPIIMDTHYAMPYMNLAQEKGLTGEIAQSEWNRSILQSELDALLGKITDTAQKDKAKTAINALIVTSVTMTKDAPIDMSGTPVFVRNGNVMVPVRKVGEALGYTVTWDAAQPTKVKLDDGVTKTTVTIGEDSYYMASSQAIGMTQPKPLGTATMLVDGYTYVPAAMFHVLNLDWTVTVTNGVLNISR